MKEYGIHICALLNLLNFTAPEERLLSFVLTQESISSQDCLAKRTCSKFIQSSLTRLLLTRAFLVDPGTEPNFPSMQVPAKQLYYDAKHNENLNILRNRKKRE